MKAIINWIVLIPVLILTVGIELFTALDPQGAQSFFGKDLNGISEIVLIAVVVLFALFFIMSLFDRKTSPVHILRHNYVAGICSVIAAFSLVGSTVATVAEGIRGTGVGAMDVVLALVSVMAAVAMLLIGINHCTASNSNNSGAFFYLSIPLWCAVHLLSRFMNHTAQPVDMADTLDLVMYVFLAIYFLYAMMVVSLINGKNPVKATVYWGAPAATASLVYAISVVGNTLSTKGASVFAYLEAVTCGFIGLYIIAFIAELSFMSKTVDEQYVSEGDLEADDEPEDSEEEALKQETVVAVELPQSDEIESEINRNMKKFFDDISSVESEVPPTEEPSPSVEEVIEAPKRDYGSYFDAEENECMFIEDEKLAVDTTKKIPVDKSKYPATNEEVIHEHIGSDEYVVGLNSIVDDDADASDHPDAKKHTFGKASKNVDSNADAENVSYEARLDEIDRLIISIQGEDSDK